MVAVMTPEYDWKTNENLVEIGELKDKPLIIYRRFEQLIRETCLENGFDPLIFCMNDDARTTLLWANAGLGIGIIPKSAFELTNNSNLIYKEINSESLRTRVAAIWIKDKYLSSLASKFIESFKNG
jgi:DNA-binding transcriptional LysR family regulator